MAQSKRSGAVYRGLINRLRSMSSYVRCRVSYVSRRTERERIVAAFESNCTVKEARKAVQKILSGLRGAGQTAAVKTLWVRINPL